MAGVAKDELLLGRVEPELDAADRNPHVLQQDQKVEVDGAVLEVEEVVTELPARALLGAAVAAACLCPSSQAWLDQVAAVVVGKLALELDDQITALGARTDDRHLTAQDVPQLRHL